MHPDMAADNRIAIVISASSDIGTAMCRRWRDRGWRVFGTYRTPSPEVDALQSAGVKLVYLDASSAESTRQACAKLRRLCPQWDVLVNGVGTQQPVGAFAEVGFDAWDESLRVNFTSQIQVIHELLGSRRIGGDRQPIVLLFAGGGTNSATQNYSAYTVSKIGLIKICELLDAEIPDTRFVIVGPGWVKTKIHEATLKAGPEGAGSNYERTLAKLSGDECTPMDRALDCCDWIIDAPRAVVSGRNFSVAFDPWGKDALAEKLSQTPDMYKLRRLGNDWTPD